MSRSRSRASTSIIFVASVLVGSICAISSVEANDRARLPLIFAAGDGDAEGVLAALDANANACRDEVTEYGETALHTAAIKANAEVVKILIEVCELEAKTSGGQYLAQTSLLWMAYGGSDEHLRGVEAFLEAGADANAKNTAGDTAWDVVAKMPEGQYRERALRVIEVHGGRSGKVNAEL